MAAPQQTPQQAPQQPQVPYSRRLFVGNLSSEVTEDHLRAFFQDVGNIDSIDFPENGGDYCHVNFATKRGARKALREKDNRMLAGQRVWCNMKLEPKTENFKPHIILQQDIMINDITKIEEVKNMLGEKYKSCGEEGSPVGRVEDVLLPKHLVKDDMGKAFVRFNTELAVQDALCLNDKHRVKPTIRVPAYTARPAENIHGGGSGGIYGFETEKGDYIFEDDKHRKVPKKKYFRDED